MKRNFFSNDTSCCYVYDDFSYYFPTGMWKLEDTCFQNTPIIFFPLEILVPKFECPDFL